MARKNRECVEDNIYAATKEIFPNKNVSCGLCTIVDRSIDISSASNSGY